MPGPIQELPRLTISSIQLIQNCLTEFVTESGLNYPLVCYDYHFIMFQEELRDIHMIGAHHDTATIAKYPQFVHPDDDMFGQVLASLYFIVYKIVYHLVQYEFHIPLVDECNEYEDYMAHSVFHTIYYAF